MTISNADFFTLAQACAAQNTEAQRMLYEYFKGKMFGVCLRYASNRQDAEDYLHEGFMAIFRDIGQFKGQGNLEGWMRRVMVNSTLRIIKKQRLIVFLPDSLPFEQLVDEEEGYSLFKDESVAELALQIMQDMPTGFRTVLNLYIIENYSHAEIATELGISEGTSKSQLNRAKAHLRKILEKKLTQ
jgi:RNA polymerase sigma factor (sigma-70 family)